MKSRFSARFGSAHRYGFFSSTKTRPTWQENYGISMDLCCEMVSLIYKRKRSIRMCFII